MQPHPGQLSPHGNEVAAGLRGTRGGSQSAGERYLDERGGRLGGGGCGPVAEAGRLRRLLCQEEHFSGLCAHWELRHNLREKGQ